MHDTQNAYKEAVQSYQSGNLKSAEQILRKILSENPQHAPSLHVMGIIGLDVGNYVIAEQLVKSAIGYQNNNPSYHFTLGRVLARQDKKQDAIKSYKDAIRLKPDFIDALNNLGTMYLSQGNIQDADEIFKSILDKNPRDLNALCNKGSILYKQGKYKESIETYNKVLEIDSTRANVFYDLGRCYMLIEKYDTAIDNFQKAITIQPDYIEPMIDIGNIYLQNGEPNKALEAFLNAKKIRSDQDISAGLINSYVDLGYDNEAILETEFASKEFPDSPQIQNMQGVIYNNTGDFSKALGFYNKALTLQPDNPGIYSNMAVAQKNIGRLDEAINNLRKALELAPQAWGIHSNLLLSMLYASFVSPEDLAQEAFRYGSQIADPLIRKRAFKNDKDPDRKLRIGYVSPDFRKHAVSYFLAPIYFCNKEEFEIFAYSKTIKEDGVTQKIKQSVDHWRDIRLMDHDAAADLIEEDKIDILVDLAGHTANNGLMIFARKPAPIQVTWLGYPSTSGMKAIDYKISDNYVDPEGMTEHLHAEKLWRLPDVFCAYAPYENSPEVINHPPFEDNGYITFGCFNNFSKVTDPVLDTWAKILDKVPDSKLMLEILGLEDDATRQDIEKKLERLNIPEDRLILIPYAKANQYILYNKIDIALDPFPAVGGTTSMDTLWMGVPFITLAGKHFGSRMGVTILENTGMPEYITKSMDEYVTKAVNLAQDREKLRNIRRGLRNRFAKSPVMDQKSFSKNMEDAYREMWKKWVSSN